MDAGYYEFHNPCNDLSKIISVVIWITGLFGNVINLLVFNQKEMRRSSVNLIFWWLSLSDLLELLIIVSYEFSCNWCFMLDPSCTILRTYISPDGVLIRASSYLLFAFQTFTALLNITLVIMRFKIVWKPIQNRSSSNDQPIQRIVNGLLIFSFVSSLPILYRVEFFGTKKEPHTLLFKYFWVQLIEICVRLGSLVGLIICGIMLIFAVTRARKDRERSLNSNQTTETGRAMKQINTLTIVIITMFIVSDFLLIVHGAIMLVFVINNAIERFYDTEFLRFMRSIMCFQLVAILVNCSYSIFCYLMYSSQYRKTLSLYLRSNKYTICILNKFKREDLEDINEVQLQTM